MEPEKGESVILVSANDWRSELVGVIQHCKEGLISVKWGELETVGLHAQEELYSLEKKTIFSPFRHKVVQGSVDAEGKKSKKKVRRESLPPFDPTGQWGIVRPRNFVRSTKMNLTGRVMSVRTYYLGDRLRTKQRYNGALDVACRRDDEVVWMLITPESWHENHWTILSPEQEREYTIKSLQLDAEF